VVHSKEAASKGVASFLLEVCMVEFVLKIRLANDAMQSSAHIVRALRRTADVIESDINAEEPDVMAGEMAKILDVNGNTVGGWKFEKR
jgi:hypothetical protein